MTDILLDEKTHDILFTNQDLTFTEDSDGQSLAQRLEIKLLIFKGEWILDEDFGVPYYQSILIKGVSKSQVDSIFQEQILTTPDVQTITSFSSNFDNGIREYTLDFTVREVNGEETQVSIGG